VQGLEGVEFLKFGGVGTTVIGSRPAEGLDLTDVVAIRQLISGRGNRPVVRRLINCAADISALGGHLGKSAPSIAPIRSYACRESIGMRLPRSSRIRTNEQVFWEKRKDWIQRSIWSGDGMNLTEACGSIIIRAPRRSLADDSSTREYLFPLQSRQC
jgi:hypothetical protein